jgi:hypothetical protein
MPKHFKDQWVNPVTELTAAYSEHYTKHMSKYTLWEKCREF